ncbi:MAG: patatin-like phospholipase family protein [Fusobacteriota bacterium]
MNKEKYCLVLSGGGAKGVYHLGVWKAIKELDIEFNAVIGNSVGALVAGFFAQDEYDALYDIMSNMGIDDFIKIPKGLLKDGNINFNKNNFKLLDDLRRDISKNNGVDTSPLTKILEDNLSEEKLRNSGMDIGIVTFHLNKIEPVEIFIDEMKEGSVLKYLQASATLPGFKSTEIDNKKFIDGGVYDNIPFSAAKSRGYKNIMVVDISGAGRNKTPDIQGTNTIYIKNSIEMGGLLDFEKNFLDEYRKLGYLDTLKVFGKLEGNRFFFEKDSEIYNSLDKIMKEDGDFKEFLDNYLDNLKINRRENSINNLKEILPEEVRNTRKLIYELADCAAFGLDMKRIKKYKFRDFIQEIYKKATDTETNLEETRKKFGSKDLFGMIKEIKNIKAENGSFGIRNKSLYYYELVIDNLLGDFKNKLSFASLNRFYPGLNAGIIFIEILRIYFSEKVGNKK